MRYFTRFSIKIHLEDSVYSLDDDCIELQIECHFVVRYFHKTSLKTAEILTALRRHPLGENAAVIGEVTTDGKVRAVGLFGQSRLLDLPRNEPLPRIC